VNKVPIYLDGFSTLPLAPEAREAMLSAWEQPGNAGSANAAGERAASIVADGRAAVATLIGASPGEIIFTSGATEANNLALLGVATALRAQGSSRRRVVISTIEHKAVMAAAAALAASGLEIVLAPVDHAGRLDLAAFADLVDDSVLIASVMMVNNETGVIQPVAEAAAMTHAHGAPFHCDAAQAAGKVPLDVCDLDVDYLSLSAHKLYGPMGVGALYMAAGAPRPSPLLHGGGQQGGIRPGTEPVALISGFGAAAKVAAAMIDVDAHHGRQLVAELLEGLSQRQVRFRSITGSHPVVPGSAVILLEAVDGDALCSAVARDVSISTGSACTAGQLYPSHVLKAIGLDNAEARSVIRIFCNRYNNVPEMTSAAAHIASVAELSRLATGEVHQ
jgi:cysteine desulfurase